jgi:hypothetical protein
VYLDACSRERSPVIYTYKGSLEDKHDHVDDIEPAKEVQCATLHDAHTCIR